MTDIDTKSVIEAAISSIREDPPEEGGLESIASGDPDVLDVEEHDPDPAHEGVERSPIRLEATHCEFLAWAEFHLHPII